MPQPVWVVESEPCAHLRVEAAGRGMIRVQVDGVEVASGRRTVAWEGRAFERASTATVTLGRDPDAAKIVTGRAEATLQWTPPADWELRPSGSSPTPTRALEIRLSGTSPCALPGLRWRVRASAGDRHTEAEGALPDQMLFATKPRIDLPVGDVRLVAEILWHDLVLATAEGSLRVPTCADEDGDGLCAGGSDCDDTDPFVRPGLPDLAGDGRNNDCDGGRRERKPPVLAGDRDGDGYDGPDRPAPTPEERAAILAAVPSRPTLADEMSTAPRLRAIDCDDTDPTVFPGATERDDGRDNDCNGVVGPIFDTRAEIVRFWPASTGRVVHKVAPPGLGIALRDGRVTRSTPEILGRDYSPTLTILETRRLQTPAGSAAWLVVTEQIRPVSSASGERIPAEREHVGWVLARSGPSGLSVTARIPLGETFELDTVPQGDWTRATVAVLEGSFHVPIVTPEGIAVGATRYRWSGEALLPDPEASPPP